MERLIELFKKKYKDEEVVLPQSICVISDNKPDPFSAGGFGYITKLRVKDNRLEYYLDWWSYGWYSDNKYPCAIHAALNMVL